MNIVEALAELIKHAEEFEPEGDNNVIVDTCDAGITKKGDDYYIGLIGTKNLITNEIAAMCMIKYSIDPTDESMITWIPSFTDLTATNWEFKEFPPKEV